MLEGKGFESDNKRIKLKLENLKVYFPIERSLKDWLLRRQKRIIRAVDDVSLDIYENEVLGLVGETGCGKSTIAKTILLINPITDGKIFFEDKEIKDLTGEELKNYFSKIQMVWQDPFSSLNPRMKVYDIISRPLVCFRGMDKKAVFKKVSEIIEVVGLNKNELFKYPHEFSGGGRQRIVIARALICEPSFLIADEPTSSLDVSIQAQILNLLKSLKDNYALTMLFITHNLAVVNFISNRVAVMYFGRIVELMSKVDLFIKNYHWYTKKLIDAIPKGKRRIDTETTLEKGYKLHHEGCIYYYQCPNARDRCFEEVPSLYEIEKSHFVACHYPRY